MLAAIDDAHFLVVAGTHGVAKDTSGLLLGGRDIGVAPRGPEIIHRKGRVADGGWGAKLRVWARRAGPGWTAEAGVPICQVQPQSKHCSNMRVLRLTLFADRCYSRSVPFGRGFL